MTNQQIKALIETLENVLSLIGPTSNEMSDEEQVRNASVLLVSVIENLEGLLS